jgi:hypothetical protein
MKRKQKLRASLTDDTAYVNADTPARRQKKGVAAVHSIDLAPVLNSPSSKTKEYSADLYEEGNLSRNPVLQSLIKVL